MYKPIYKTNDLILGTGKSTIVTGWTDKRQVAKYFDKEDYAAIGNLYDSFIGIDFLIANVLANPCIASIEVYCDYKNELSVSSLTALYYLFNEGYTETSNGFLINSYGKVSKAFSSEDIDDFRAIPFGFHDSIEKVKEGLNSCKNFESKRVKKVIELNTVIESILPTGRLYNYSL